MPAFRRYDWILGLGFLASFLDAYGIGANDVANSFATSVSSRSLSLFQATIAAAICEFLGCVLAGSRVTDTIRSKVINTNIFQRDPAVLMLAMLTAESVSSVWLIIATRFGFPVSTTHSITGAIIGVGIAATGKGSSVSWGWKGVGAIFASWIIAPAVAGGFATSVYLTIKYLVLNRKNSTKAAIILGPIYFFIAASVLTMTIAWKGAPNLKLDKLSTATTLGAIFGTGAVVCALAILFWVPFVYAKVVRGDYTIRWYHFFYGPLLWKREPPADASEFTAAKAVPDYYAFSAARPEPDPLNTGVPGDNEKQADSDHGVPAPAEGDRPKIDPILQHDLVRPKWTKWNFFFPQNAPRYYLFSLPWHNMRRDVVSMQAMDSRIGGTADHVAKVHGRAKQYPNQTEHAFSFLQVLTACTMSFAHGSNDIANAIGPFATIYLIWKDGNFAGSKAPVPVWILAYGGAGLVLGLATYGYKIMAVLGNRITLHSPSRGFSMEFGAAITVAMATRLALPISTTQSIAGATIAVGLCNGDYKAINWKMVLWICFGWVITLPVTGLFSGLIFAVMINSPRFGFKSTITS